MNARHRTWGIAGMGVLALGALAGCGGKSAAATEPEGGPGVESTFPVPGSGQPRDLEPGLGWSIRDATPYSRREAAAVIDTTEDRFIVFGGGGRDVWALSLSGAHERTWSQISPVGEEAPARAARSGVYDARRHRLLLLVDDIQGADPDYDDVQLWALWLGTSPRFERLVTNGPTPGQELAGAQLALDASGERLFAVGGVLDACGSWQLALDEQLMWSRLADGPITSFDTCGLSYAGGSGLVFDDLRQRLLAFGLGGEWQLGLGETQWSALPAGHCRSPLDTPTYDARRRRIIYGTGGCSTSSSYSLDDDAWSSLEPLSLPHPVAVDAARDRAIYLSSGLRGSNATQALDLGELQLSELTPDSRGESLAEGSTAVWDPARQQGVSFGGDAEAAAGQTWARGLDPAGKWHTFGASFAAKGWGMPGAYDPVTKAVVALAPNGSELAVQVLPSGGSGWEVLPASGAPSERSGSLLAYDHNEQRLLVRGGQHDASYGGPSLDEVWALLTGAEPRWQQLRLTGEGPGAGAGEVGVYDAARSRLIVLRELEPDADHRPQHALHGLTLSGDSGVWRPIEAQGNVPVLAQVRVVFDEGRERMIALSLGGWGPLVAALDVTTEPPTWHRFCDVGTPPPETFGTFALATLKGELFVAAGNGTFRFDLATPYCD
jgi:hypothetical protein